MTWESFCRPQLHKRMNRSRHKLQRSVAERLPSGPLGPTSLVEQISGVLKEAILEGILKGGEKLVETELKEKFGVSRSPIREALRDLEKKGLVEIFPRKGAFVRPISSKDIRENFPVRAVLEGLAAKEALERFEPDRLLEMEKAFQKMREAAQERDGRSYWEHHRLFHETFIQACGNQLLMGLLKDLRTHALWYRFSYQYYQEDLGSSLAIHESILEVFRTMDPNRGKELEQMVRAHIEQAMERFLSYLAEQDATPESVSHSRSMEDEMEPYAQGRIK